MPISPSQIKCGVDSHFQEPVDFSMLPFEMLQSHIATILDVPCTGSASDFF